MKKLITNIVLVSFIMIGCGGGSPTTSQHNANSHNGNVKMKSVTIYTRDGKTQTKTIEL